MSRLNRGSLFVTCLTAMASFTVSCAIRQRSTPDSAWLRDNWAFGLPFASTVEPLRLGMSFSEAEASRPQAVPIKFVGLADSLGQWILQYEFPEGQRTEPRLTMEDWQPPDAGAPLTSISGYSFRTLARDAEEEWSGIVRRWRRGHVTVRCWTFTNLGDGRYAVAAQASDTAVAYFERREPGWEGPPYESPERSPLGFVAVELTSGVRPAFKRLRGSSVRCP